MHLPAIVAFDNRGDAGTTGVDTVHGESLPGIEPTFGVQGQRAQPLADDKIVTQLLSGIFFKLLATFGTGVH